VNEIKEYELVIGESTWKFTFGKLAEQANGAVLIEVGDTVVLVTATASSQPREGINFLPLRTDYEERQYAAGRIPGSFFRREGKPTDKAILAARLIDRPIRPLFPQGFRNELQVIATVLSFDPDHAPEICGIVGASIALGVSDIPWDGPIGAVRVGLVDGELIINPNEEQDEASDLDLVLAGNREGIIMVEAGAREVPEETILEALDFGHEAIMPQLELQERMIRELGKETMDVPVFEVSDELQEIVRSHLAGPIKEALLTEEKGDRNAHIEEVKSATLSDLLEQFPEQEEEITSAMKQVEKEELRRSIVDDNLRPDGRKAEEIRPLSSQVALLPRAHGSGLFTRGQTQVLTVTALGPVGDRQLLDSLGHNEELKRYLHHYNFPPFCVGEARPLRAPSRREIGHGALAERALISVIPEEPDFPYTIRLVSEVLSSNGSSSMASVCGSTLSLMDAGVPIRAPVAGIAMGLIKERDQIVVLTDIQGIEDFLGDMDFKVAGTQKGVTAIQMDMKISGVSAQTLREAMERARQGRLAILDNMLQAIPAPREELSPYAPRIITMHIDVEKIRDVIGPGGKTINKIIAETGVKIDIEDDGQVYISSTDEAGAQEAVEWIERLTQDPEVGKNYLGKVVRVVDFGAFVEILPNKDGLVHISNISTEHINKVTDELNVGDHIYVKLTEIDDLGRLNLSREKALLENPEGAKREEREGHDAEATYQKWLQASKSNKGRGRNRNHRKRRR